MKRFTETNKWRDPWFRKLTDSAKLLFLWLVDNCDNSGVIDLDFEASSFDIGKPIEANHLAELGSRYEKLANGKIRLTKFIAFQYGTLSEKCTPHLRIIETLQSHGISYPENPSLSTTLHTTLPPTLQSRVQERKGKEEERKGKEPEGGTGGNGQLDCEFVSLLLSLYRRPEGSVLTYAEQSTLAAIVRERPRYRDEFKIIESLKERDPRYFPQSLSRLLEGWQDALDRANNHVPKGDASKPAETVFEITKVIEAKTKLANDLKNQYASEGALSTDWTSPEKRLEHAKLRGEIKTLTQKIARMA